MFGKNKQRYLENSEIVEPSNYVVTKNIKLHYYACLEYDLAITVLQMVHLFESVLFNECAKWETNLSKSIQASVKIIQH